MNFMHYALLLFITFSSLSVFGQIGTGEWRLHVPARNAYDVAANSENVYAAFENGLAEYNFAYNEISTLTGVSGLSDITISCLGTCVSNDAVFVGYENGNIDKIKGNSIENIPAIALAELQGSRKIYRFVEYDDHIYAATAFGIVKIDPSKNEVRDTYYPTSGMEPIIDLIFFNDSIYALTKTSMYRGALSSSFTLADPAYWTIDTRVYDQGVDNEYSDIEEAWGTIYINLSVSGYGKDTLYSLQSNSIQVETFAGTDLETHSLRFINDKLVICNAAGGGIFNSSLTMDTYFGYTFGTAQPNNVTFADNKYWIADNVFGLVQFSNPWSNAVKSISGPPKGQFYAMDWNRDRLAVVSGGLNGLANTYSGGGMYTFQDEQWSLYDRQYVSEWSGTTIFDFLSVAISPRDENEMAVGTFSKYPLTLFHPDGTVDTFTVNNSILEEPTGSSIENILISGLEYDSKGNLWILNGNAQKPLKVFTKDQEWYDFNTGSASKNKFSRKLAIDYNGYKWFSERNGGLFGFDDNGTISDPSDDRYVNLNTGEYSGALPSDDVTAVAVDFDNEIWIGTDDGFAILYNSESAFDAGPGEYNAQRIKLEYEGNVEYMLGSTYVTDIEVDGGNRKWFGTANSGIILLSADGQEIIEQHTIENSPLISNNILDLELDHNTGELYIVTDQGLVSYRTDATYDDPNYSDVKVFPNPVRPNFDGVITIQGIQYDSDVKFTDAAGNLVYKTTSNGGTATWDGKTLWGDKVESGVYLIWTAPNEGKGRYVGKVVVVN